MIKIEKDVPLPKMRGGDGSFKTYASYPFKSMEVFDSILIPSSLHLGNARRAAHKYGKDNNKKFVTKMEGEGLRVWRVK